MRNLYPTKAQIEAARRNGAKSRGPLSPQTRARSAQNARKHGLCAKTLLGPGESAERLQDLFDDLYEEFQPQTTSEYLLLEDLVAAAWRKLRARGFEQAFLADEVKKGNAASTREAWSQSANARNAARYEATHRRAFDTARRELLAVTLFRQALDEPESGTPPERNEPGSPQKEEVPA